MRSGWDFGWFVRRSSPRSNRCTAIGTAAWKMSKVPQASRPARSVAVLLVFPASAPAARPRLFEAVEPHMGTLFRIKLYATDEVQAKAAFQAAFGRVAELDAGLSDYKPDSELNRICRTAVGVPVRISDDLFQVLTASQNLATETG